MEEDPSSTGYRIRNSEIPILLCLRGISSLRPHEETVPTDLDKLVESLREDPSLRHPIIADTETGLVLDGTHRLAALRLLGCGLVPCALVNYNSPRIMIERWFRAITGSSLDDFKARLVGRNMRDAETSSAEKCLSKRTCYASVEDRKSCLVFPSSRRTPIELARKSFEIENLARKSGLTVTYCDKKTWTTPRRGFVLSTIQLEKNEVVASCLRKVLFPPKTTRHIIPSRPLGISVPLDWLGTNSVKDSQRRFIEHLSSKRVRHLPKGSKIGSRKYQEEVFVFE